jgi:hypothetical protein
MKTYIEPKAKIMHLQTISMLTQSKRGGVQTGDKVGDEYNPNDVSYGKEYNDWDE